MRTLVTGGFGVVGKVLRPSLAGLDTIFATHRELDLLRADETRNRIAGYEQVVHLASPLRGRTEPADAIRDSIAMTRNLFDAVRASSVRRIVLPSSILATSAVQLRGSDRIAIENARPAEDDFGRSRLEVERMGREFANETQTEVIAIRLGTIRIPDRPSREDLLRPHWLSHEDCGELFRVCLAAPVVAGRLSLFYAVSDTKGRILDTSNPFGWTPRTREVGIRRRAVGALFDAAAATRGVLRIRTRLAAISGRTRD